MLRQTEVRDGFVRNNPSGVRLGIAATLGIGLIAVTSEAHAAPDSSVKLMRACEQGDGDACTSLFREFLEVGGRVLDDPATQKPLVLVSLNKACETGVLDACVAVADCYQSGSGVAKDEAEALRRYGLACDAGQAVACERGAKIRDHGDDPALHDRFESTRLSQHACDLGQVITCGKLADQLRLVGRMDLAGPLYVKACDGPQPYLPACSRAGAAYQSGSGVAVDLPLEIAMYARGCDQKDAASCVDLGLAHYQGRGVALDIVAAVASFETGCASAYDPQSAAQGCRNLALLYSQGQSVPKDEPKATAYAARGCELAAKAGLTCTLVEDIKAAFATP